MRKIVPSILTCFMAIGAITSFKPKPSETLPVKEYHATAEKALRAVQTEKAVAMTAEEQAKLFLKECSVQGEINAAMPDEEVFAMAYKGYAKLKESGTLGANSKILAVADLSKSSNTKRLWIFDMEAKKVLFHTLVSHGKNTGDEFAERFSNKMNSLQSSVGFFVTAGTYQGENGYSLKLKGMDAGYNDAAEQRAIVMHGADYVSEAFAAAHKRIGRSWGCPALPRALTRPIIDILKNNNCLFIYGKNTGIETGSKWLKDA